MSRSYKKTPIYQDQPFKKFGKKFANKTVRYYLKNHDLADGKSYRKVYETWDIRDYKFYCTLAEYMHDNDPNHDYWLTRITKEERINDWKKHYYRK